MVSPIDRAVGGPASGLGLVERDEGEVLSIRTLEVYKRRGRAVHARPAPVRSDVFAEDGMARAGCESRHLFDGQLFSLSRLFLDQEESHRRHGQHQNCNRYRREFVHSLRCGHRFAARLAPYNTHPSVPYSCNRPHRVGNRINSHECRGYLNRRY